MGEQRQPVIAQHGHRLAQLALADVRELVDARVDHERLAAEHAGPRQVDQRAGVAGHDAAPEADVDGALALAGGDLGVERGARRRHRGGVERHVDDGRDAAGRGGARRRVEAFPLGAAGLVDVDVRVDQPGRDDQVADVDHVRQRHPLGHDRLDPLAGDQHGAGRHAVGAHHPPAADAPDRTKRRVLDSRIPSRRSRVLAPVIPGPRLYPRARRYTWPWRSPSC